LCGCSGNCVVVLAIVRVFWQLCGCSGNCAGVIAIVWVFWQLCGCSGNCVGVLVIVLLFWQYVYLYLLCFVLFVLFFCFIYVFYSYLFCLYRCKDCCCHRVTQLVIINLLGTDTKRCNNAGTTGWGCSTVAWRRRDLGVRGTGQTGEWRKLHSEELQDLFSFQINQGIILMKMRWTGHVAHMG